ncbi:hypothetical protein B0H10DRAFT_1837609 [Mycena sp. CBHHK59/15]|nr:hypothetical protein B0H10DRAFT_1837609 [Mycena sp. CBHHK59/15]
MPKRKIGSLQSTVASDSDSEHDDLPHSRHEGLLHRAIRTDGEGRTHVSTNRVAVPTSPTKKKTATARPPGRGLGLSAGSDGDSGSAPLESPFPFAQEDSFAFDEGHPVDPGPQAERESVWFLISYFSRQLLTSLKKDRPNTPWAKYRRDCHLDELLHLEGRGYHRYQSKCAHCPTAASEAIYRCKDCFTDALLCKPCLVELHRDNPLHCVEVWGRDFFTGISLKSLGLRIQLGHGRNGMCPGTLAKRARAAAGTANAGVEEGETDAKSSRDDFCIVASNGIHEVGLDFCTCGLAEDHDIQLLCARLYPSTITNPSSAATFDVLRAFHLLSLEAKCSAHHFYNSLARRTNNNGVFQPRNRYNEFRRMTRQWRHLQMLKRTGRVHAADGIAGTKAGECALLCPACPQPGKNLPGDGSWRLAPREKCLLYALFLALDANFRMKRKHVSSEADDPSLGDGIAFSCKVAEYMQHLDEHWDEEQEKSTCVAHDAVDEPDRESYSTASSGIGTVDCARHNMKRPNGIGDLQKGERYINMDYMLWMSLANHDDIVQLFVSYDIVCQWHKNIWRRLAKYGPKLVERGFKHGYVWLIPKFHLPAHIEACNILYSFNLTPFVGQTDGEAPERGWANTNPLANSTKEMGPGVRCDALDDHFNDWNHKKILGLGKYLLERVQKAIANMTTFRLELLEAELGLPDAVVVEWTKEMEDWESDAEKPNPFKVTDEHEGLFAIRGRLATAAVASRAGDTEDDVRGDLHASEMIDMGLHLEEQQRDLASDAGALKTHATDRQKTALLERSNKLGRKLSEWMKIRESLTPTLWLPSRLATTPDTVVKESHARYEFQLWVGQAHEALREVQTLLLVRTKKYSWKDDFAHGVAANTRAKTSIKLLDERLRRTAQKYRVTRAALAVLSPRLNETEWKTQLRPLSHDDVRQRPQVEVRRKELEERPASWIWLTLLSEEEDAETGMTEALRIEWARTRARAWRWTEEVDLLEEEMRRVLEFLKWRAGWWMSLVDQRPEVVEDVVLQEGFTAYA